MELIAIPSYLKTEEALNFVNDLLENEPDIIYKEQYIRDRLSTIACHNSVRAGRKLNIIEMNDLLSQIEENDTAYQCNHHRPSYFKLSKNTLDKIFERV